MTFAQDAKDIADYNELIRDLNNGVSRFNTRTTELLDRALRVARDDVSNRHEREKALIEKFRDVCAREFGMPRDTMFFKSTYQEDYVPKGRSHPGVVPRVNGVD